MRYKIAQCCLVVSICLVIHFVLEATTSTVYVGFFDDNSIGTINSHTNTLIGNLIDIASPNFECQGLAVTPNGKYLYEANQNGNVPQEGTVGVIDTITRSVIKYITVGHGAVNIAITPNGDYAYVSNYYDHTVSVINTATLQTVGTAIPVGIYPYGIKADPTGQYIYVVCSEEPGVDIISTATNTVVDHISIRSFCYNIAIRPNGKIAYVTTNEGDLAMLDLKQNQVLSYIKVASGPLSGIAMAPNGKHVYVANYNNREFVVIRTVDNEIVKRLALQDHPNQIAVLPNGKYAYITSTGSSIFIADLSNNTLLTQTIVAPGVSQGIVAGPDSKHHRLLQAVTSTGMNPFVPLKGVNGG